MTKAADIAVHRSHRRAMSAVAGAVAASVLTFGLSACGHGRSGLGQLSFSGQVLLTSVHGSPRPVKSGVTLHPGDRILVTAGAAMATLTTGVLQLRSGTDVTIANAPHLTAGAMLIQPGPAGLRVTAERASLLVPSGVAQLAVGPAADLTAKVYQAAAELDIPGNPPAYIGAPRQILLSADTHLPITASPLQYQSSDGWDRQYLASAVAISSQLAAVEAGFNAQLAANQGKDASFYQQLLPALSGRPDFAPVFYSVQQQQPSAAAAVKPGDYLIASVIALRGSAGSFSSRLTDELAFAGQGASWGFVAYDQGVTDLSGVVSDVLAAIGRAQLPFSGAPANQIAIGPPKGTTTPTTRPVSRAVTSAPPTTTATTIPGTPRPSRAPTTTTTTSPPLIHLPVPVLPGPLGSILNPLLDPLIQALNNLLSGKH